jgi:hypothetical protein
MVGAAPAAARTVITLFVPVQVPYAPEAKQTVCPEVAAATWAAKFVGVAFRLQAGDGVGVGPTVGVGLNVAGGVMVGVDVGVAEAVGDGVGVGAVAGVKVPLQVPVRCWPEMVTVQGAPLIATGLGAAVGTGVGVDDVVPEAYAETGLLAH